MTQQKDRLKQPPFAILRGGYKYKETSDIDINVPKATPTTFMLKKATKI